MYKRKRLGPFRTVAIRNSEVGRYSGGVNVQYEWQKKSVPEVASAIWSQSAIGEVRYRRFHCINFTATMYVLVLRAHSEMAILQQSARDVMAPDAKSWSKQVRQVVLERCEGGGALFNQRAHKLQQLHKKCVWSV